MFLWNKLILKELRPALAPLFHKVLQSILNRNNKRTQRIQLSELRAKMQGKIQHMCPFHVTFFQNMTMLFVYFPTKQGVSIVTHVFTNTQIMYKHYTDTYTLMGTNVSPGSWPQTALLGPSESLAQGRRTTNIYYMNKWTAPSFGYPQCPIAPCPSPSLTTTLFCRNTASSSRQSLCTLC